MYGPLREAGLCDLIELRIVLAFCSSFSGPKETLPIPTWMMACLSTRYSILPALASLTAFSTSAVTVPALGLGIRPFGPNCRAYLPSLGM